jgi:hypothetical protein
MYEPEFSTVTPLKSPVRWVQVADAPGCTAACRLIVQPENLDVPTCTTRCSARYNNASDTSSERWK